jgi:hypothetical protein
MGARRMGPQNRFSFFDRRKQVVKDVVKMGDSSSILNTPFLNSTGLKRAKTAKPHKMNVLHRNIVKIPFCRASKGISAGASASTVVPFLGVAGIVAERNRAVLNGRLRDSEPFIQPTCSRYVQLRRTIQ